MGSTIQIVFIYLSSISVLLRITPVCYYFPSYLRSFLLVSIACLFVLRFRTIVNKNLFGIVCVIAVSSIISALFLTSNKVVNVLIALSPYILYLAIRKRDYNSLKPLIYLVIGVLLVDVILSFYERLTMSHFFIVPYGYSYVLNGISLSDNNEVTFRAMALFGHPLTNANILCFSAFSFYFSTFGSRNIRIAFLLISLFSILFCFASRGAALFSLPLLFLIFFNDITKQHWFYILVEVIVTIILVYYIIENIESIAPRLVEKGIDDDGALTRIISFRYYWDSSFSDKFYGNVKLPYNENGFLMYLAESGLILGSILIVCYTILWWKMLDGMSLKNRVCVFVAFFIVGNMNNNLYSYEVPSMYAVVCTLIIRGGLVISRERDLRYKKRQLKDD